MKNKILFEIRDNYLFEIAKTFKTSEKSILEDVDNLKSWMKTQSHLPEILDNKSIQNFFILNKCSIEKTKQSIDMYYTLRSKLPDMYENVNPKLENMTEIMKIMYWVPLSKPTPEMHRVLFFKMRDKTLVDKMDPHEVIGHIFNLQEIRLKEDVMFGDIIVIDMDGVTLGYLSKLTPSIIFKFITMYEKIFSIPLKACYIINSPAFINTVVAIVKSIMKPKLFKRIHICQDTSILYQRLPKEILPSDYEGQEKSMEEVQQLLIAKLNEFHNRYDLLDNLRVNEELRPAPLQNDEVLGFHGNFKKLNLD